MFWRQVTKNELNLKRERESHIKRLGEKEKETETDRLRDSESQRETETQRERERENHPQT